MNYHNGREAKVGDGIVSLTNHLAGVVSRTDLEKLQFLTFGERKAGEPYNLIPVTVGARGQERHWEPVGIEVPSGTCVHVEDAGQAANEVIAVTKAAATALNARSQEIATLKAELAVANAALAGTAPVPVPGKDPNQGELLAEGTGPAKTEEEGQSLTGQTPNSGTEEEEEKEEEKGK